MASSWVYRFVLVGLFSSAGCGEDSLNSNRAAPLEPEEVGDADAGGGPVGATDSGEGDTDAAGDPAPVRTYFYGPWSGWSACDAACGNTGTQGRQRACLDDLGAEVACATCGGACSESRACNEACAASCPEQTLTAPTDVAGVSCTDTLPITPAGTETYSPRPWGTRCRGAACSLGAFCSETPYLGTVSGGSFGVCENYCAVRARCEANGTWTVTGFTW